MSKVTLNGHVLSIYFDNWAEVVKYLQENPLASVHILQEDGGYTVSRPLPEDERGAYLHLYRLQSNKPPKPPKPPSGPKGGGPSGTPGSARPAKYTKTEAIAA